MKSKVLYGPPGTGKTTRLVAEVQERIKAGIPPTDIGIVSFTKAAATEIAHRVALKNTSISGIHASTLHSLSFRLAELSKERVIDAAWAAEFTKVSGIELKLVKDEDIQSLPDGDAYYALYCYAKAVGADDEHSMIAVYENSPRKGTLTKFLYFIDSYEAFKEARGVVDFNDMLVLATGKDPGFKVLFLDEAQDFTPLQWDLIESWIPYLDEIVLAGDDDQAIYRWGGADPYGMPTFAEKYGSEQEVLSQSYRVPSSVHELAEKVISGVSSRVTKEYKPRAAVGQIRRFGDAAYLKFKHGEDTLILVRNHDLRRDIEEVLVNNGIPYKIDSGWPGRLHDKYARAVRYWLEAVRTLDDDMSPGIGSRQIQSIAAVAKPIYKDKILKDLNSLIQSGMNWSRALSMPPANASYLTRIIGTYGNLEVEPTIRISTIHGSKGREADRVVLVNGMTQATAESRDTDSEFRTFYVGVTRTRDLLDIVQAQDGLQVLL